MEITGAEIKGEVLILGGTSQSALYVSKKLKEYGLKIVLVDWYGLPLKFSKYIDEYHDIGSPAKNVDLFFSNLLSLLKARKFKGILPIHDPAIEVCRKFKSEISKWTKIVGLNPDEIQDFASNKWKLMQLARILNIPVPESIYIDGLNILSEKKENIKYPCVIKPVSSAMIINNRLLEFGVKVATNENQLIDYVREFILNTPVIIQEFITGFGIGYNLISKDGDILNAYIHRRIHENNGVSSFRESLSTENFNVKKLVENLIREIKWTGVAMVEFKMNGEKPYLMEINGRFWGSIEVGIRSGLNYPVLLYEMEVLGRLPQRGIPFRNVSVRNLREEIIINIANLAQGKIKRFSKWIVSLLKSFSASSYIEDNIFDDSGFVWAMYKRELNRLFLKYFGRVKKNQHQQVALNKNQSYTIAFICGGNICRSPFAEKIAKIYDDKNQYLSFGTVQHENRLPPMNAVLTASEFGVDLQDFHSKSLIGREVEFIDYFIAMDNMNYNTLIKMKIDPLKIKFLSSAEIPDPYQRDIEYFRMIYNQIASEIKNIF